MIRRREEEVIRSLGNRIVEAALLLMLPLPECGRMCSASSLTARGVSGWDRKELSRTE